MTEHRDLTEAEKNKRAREIRECLRLYMLTPDFEVRAILACDEIQKGALRTAAELADALGLPEPFLAAALEQHAKQFLADHGGLN
jgi:O6-methylguanine-DNA--protein-cysteine methyltransferase